ncbi:MAG TPA: hypothetical protein VFW00_07175 [Rhodocyclaceae bacterium]|nr:hypothetical protein [Rhodocyclaceae bacterium]
MADPTLVNGKWLVPKDPDDKRWYKFGFAKDLTDSGTTAASVTAILSGVTLGTVTDGQPNPRISGTDVLVFLSGLDVTDGALNFCTARLVCANGEQIDRTMWYVREDH